MLLFITANEFIVIVLEIEVVKATFNEAPSMYLTLNQVFKLTNT